MQVIIPLEETNLGFHLSFSGHDRDQAACIFLCSMNVRQSSLSFQRTLPYIVHTTKTFNLCVLHPPSTGNIYCALIFSISSLKKYYFSLSSFLICRVKVLDTDRINVETKDHHYIY